MGWRRPSSGPEELHKLYPAEHEGAQAMVEQVWGFDYEAVREHATEMVGYEGWSAFMAGFEQAVLVLREAELDKAFGEEPSS
jgi:hypothetical protein